ncbi:MAG: FAD:protein FMN transferase [Ostreibacterium sp.]
MRNFILAVFSFFLLLACQRVPEMKTITGYAQGTTYSVKYWSSVKNLPDTITLKQLIDSELNRVDELMSNYRDDSAIERFNHNKVANIPIMLDKEILAVLKVSAKVYKLSEHCYDPTIKPLFQLWGFSQDKLTIPDATEISKTLKAIGFNKVKRDAKSLTKENVAVTVDLSAIGQGYAVSRVAKLLEKHNISNYLVEIGGEMLVAGTKPKDIKWRVGVERPVPNSQKISEVITVTGQKPTAIMTSGTYRHFFDKNGKQYSHILDPRTGKPITHNGVAVTVLLDDATLADAWSTALLCLGSKEGLKIAKDNDISAIFYDMDKGKLSRQVSANNVTKNTAWEIK